MVAMTLPEFMTLKEARGRLLGLDLGDKTLGLALSDSLWLIASPGRTLKRSKITVLQKGIEDFLGQETLSGMVVGLPKNLDGSLGPRAKGVMDFSYALGAALGVPYVFWDERFSTQGAGQAFQNTQLSSYKKNEAIDAMAASFMLQGFLDYCYKEKAYL
jgi:putative Holliday junction resolvase